MKLHRVLAGSLGIGMIGVAHAQDTTSELIVGSWQLDYATEGCSDLKTTQTWTFLADGTFSREEDGAKVVGSWSLAEEGRELHLSLTDGTALETHVILVLDGKQLELLTPTLVEKGMVLQQERFAAFFHS